MRNSAQNNLVFLLSWFRNWTSDWADSVIEPVTNQKVDEENANASNVESNTIRKFKFSENGITPFTSVEVDKMNAKVVIKIDI